jgi:hypothetical protein
VDSVTISLIALLATGSAGAHHSLTGVYDSARPATVEGRVTEFRFVSPHPILVIEVETAGTKVLWQLEMDNRFELAAIGIDASTYQPGQRVIAGGSMAYADDNRLYLLRLERPADGFLYRQVGSTPSVESRSPQ